MFTVSLICYTNVNMAHHILGAASRILSRRDLLKMFLVIHNCARLRAEICANWQCHCMCDVSLEHYVGLTVCIACFDHLSFAIALHQIVETYLTFRQEGLVPQLVFIVKPNIYAYIFKDIHRENIPSNKLRRLRKAWVCIFGQLVY